jgi:hypothetical protein
VSVNGKHVASWALGITTAPRPESTLRRTGQSLAAAGWSDYQVFDDVDGAGAWRNWIDGLAQLVDREPHADAYMMVQDDAVFCRGLRAYLERTLWPAADVALCSPYCPTPYKQRRHGWNRQSLGWDLVGAVCWVFPPSSARALLRDLAPVEAQRQIDARIGCWAAAVGRSVWYHTPSLAQHIGMGNSALGDPLVNALRTAGDFVGEEVSADA